MHRVEEKPMKFDDVAGGVIIFAMIYFLMWIPVG
jgi:hypothetical protein